MTDHCDNEVALPKLKYPIHQYKVIRTQISFGGYVWLILSRDLQERTREKFAYPTLTEASKVRSELLRLRRSMRALLSIDED